MAKSKQEKEDQVLSAAVDGTKSEEKVIPVGASEEGPSAEDMPTETAKSEIDQLKAQVLQLEDQKLRALAELDNFRKRTARQLQDTIRGANDRLLFELLEIVDNLERALKHKDEGDDRGANGEAVRKGMELIYNQMIDLLARYDVKAIESLGKPFDANLHEALMPIESDEYDEGTVAIEISRGYRQGERVLRHARVGVSRRPETGWKEGAEKAPEQG